VPIVLSTPRKVRKRLFAEILKANLASI
jgi:hypothetical protein